MAVGLMALAYRDSELDDIIAVAGALALALLASWTLPLPTPELSLWVFRVQADRVGDFSTAAIVFTVLLGAGPFVLLPQVARPGRWAALSAAMPLAAPAIAYWRHPPRQSRPQKRESTRLNSRHTCTSYSALWL